MLGIIGIGVALWLFFYAIAFMLVSPESRKASAGAKLGKRVASAVVVRNAARFLNRVGGMNRWN